MRCYFMREDHIAAVELLDGAPDLMMPPYVGPRRCSSRAWVNTKRMKYGIEIGWFSDFPIMRPASTPPDIDTPALELLLQAYRDEIVLLRTRAKECETDMALVAECIHRANNLQAIVDGHERLNARREARAGKS